MALFRNNNRIINVKEQETPIYRAYGKKKTVRPWQTKLNDLLTKAATLFLLLPMVAMVALTVISAVWFSKLVPSLALVVIILNIALLFVLYLIVFRIPRKRMRFLNKLKKTCKSNGYKITYCRSFLQSLRWANDERVDLVVRAGSRIYYVKLFGAQKKMSDIVFLPNGELEYRTRRLKNNLTLIFDLKPKSKTFKVCFPNTAESENIMRAVVLNPVPEDIYKKKLNGDTEISGNQGEMFGYTVFSGSGFIEYITRNAENERSSSRVIKH